MKGNSRKKGRGKEEGDDIKKEERNGEQRQVGGKEGKENKKEGWKREECKGN